MTFIWKYYQEDSRQQVLDQLEQRLQRLAPFFEEKAVLHDSTLPLWESFLELNLDRNSQHVGLLLLLQGLQRYYNQPAVKLALVESIINHMGSFRYATMGWKGFKSLKRNVSLHCSDLLRPIQLKVERKALRAFAWIQPCDSKTWIISFNLLSLERKLQTLSLDEMAGFLEYCFIHELTHWIQFQFREDRIAMDQASKNNEWTERWFEREAMYTSECLQDGRLYSQTCSHSFARKVVQEVQLEEQPYLLAFQADILTPYFQRLKQQVEHHKRKLQLSVQLSV